MLKKILVLTGSLVLVNCASSETVEQPTAGSSSKAQMPLTTEDSSNQQSAKADQPVEFFDSDMFDWHLSEALSAGQTAVEVKPAAPFTLNEIPKRMDIWLSAAVHEYGGKVETKPDPAYPQSKAIIGEIVDLVVQLYGAVKKNTMYSPAENYNLTVYYKPGTGTVTKMVFTHK
jgi:hypothetical protein